MAALGPCRGLGMRRRRGWVFGLVSWCRLVLPARFLVCSWPVDAAVWNSQSRVDDFLCDDDNGRTADRQCRRTTYASVIVAAPAQTLTLRGAATGPWALALARNVEILACHWPMALMLWSGGEFMVGARPPCRLGLHFSFFARCRRSVPFGASQASDLSRQLYATTALRPTDRQA